MAWWHHMANTIRVITWSGTVYPKKYAHGFVVLCFVVVMQSFIMNSHEEFIHIHQGCFAGTGAIVRLPQCQWSKPDGYGKISQCITTTKHSKAKTVCIFLGIYCTRNQAIACTNIGLLSMRSSSIHVGIILHEMLTTLSLKMDKLRLQSHLTGTSELNYGWVVTSYKTNDPIT